MESFMTQIQLKVDVIHGVVLGLQDRVENLEAKIAALEEVNTPEVVYGSPSKRKRVDIVPVTITAAHDEEISRILNYSQMEANVDERRREMGLHTIGRVDRSTEIDAELSETDDSDWVDTVDCMDEKHVDDDAAVVLTSMAETKYNNFIVLGKKDLENPLRGIVQFGEIDEMGFCNWFQEYVPVTISYHDRRLFVDDRSYACVCDGLYFPVSVHGRFKHADKHLLTLEGLNTECMRVVNLDDSE
jgi:hypothetical protein